MPIDAKGSKFERSISNINSNNRLSQSTSYQSFHNKTSHQVASSVVSSKSNNSLGQGLSEGLIENEELIEKLFPKCRPRSKTFERKPANPKDPSESQSGVNEREMSNATSSGESTKLVEHSSNEWTGRSVLSRRTLHHRRTWNFMDISPSPSPPPLSPIDDHSPCDFKQSQQANSSANLARSDSDTTSDKILSSSHLRSNQTMHYLSNELANNCAFRNRRPNLGSSVETNKCEAIQDKWNEKSQTSYYQGNEPGSKAANREVGANFRLDTLLLSPEKKHDSNRISNGIRKTNRIALDLDQTDDDDILFSRIGEIKTIERVNCSNQNCLKSPNEKTGHVYSSENKSSCDDLQRFTTDSYRDESVGKRTVSSEERSSKSVIRKSDSTEDEDNETTMVIRNRIEIAGGKELFSSSRTSRGRSKKRSHQPDGQSCLVKSWSESSRTSSSSARQTQLFSMSSMHTADNSRVPEIVPSSGEECQAVDHCRSQQTTDQVVSREHCHFKPLVLDRGCPSPPDANQCCQQTAPESTHVSQRSLYVSSQLLDENDRTQLNKGCRDVLDVSDDIQSNFSSQHENKCRMSLHGESSAIQFYSNSIEDQSVNDDTHETNRSLTPELPSHDTEQPVLEDNSSQQHLCDKFDTDNDVSLTCDQFARDLKTKLNVVSEFQQTTKHEIKCDAECCVNEDENDSNDDQNEGSNRVDLHGDTSSVGSCLSKKSFDVNHERIARVIGSVPIAQYEGSPKRYGPKPGYPKRVLASNDSLAKQTSTDYDTVLEKIEPEMRTVKGSTLSSDNGSPHSSSASSSSSATFSSSDIHSSSSFSCPTNQNQSSRFYNWNLPSPKNSIEGNLSVSLNRRLVYNDHKITPGVGPKHISRDEVVKSILSIPNGPVDTEEDGDDVTLSKKMPLHKDGDSVTTSISLSSQPKSEPLYSTLIFPNKCDATKSNGYEQNHLTKPSLLEDKVSNGCDLVMQKSTSSVKPNQMATNDVLSRDSVPLNHRYKLTSGDGSSAMRSVPKSLQLSQYPEYRFQASQSFESTDSSYRSDKFSSRDYYYGQSDEDLYLYEQKTNFPLKDACSFLNGSTSEDKHLNANVGKLSYVTCLSPELSIAKDHSTYLNTLNSDAHSMCPEKGLYSDKFATELTGPTLNTMPILEDGLSSGMPSSDEMDYDEEDDCEEDLAPTEQDLDEYVNEYNNNRTVLGCESVTTSQCASGLNSDLVNGVESATYSTYRYKTSALDEFEKSGKSAADGAAAQQFVFQCPNKTQYTLETVDELGKKKKESSYHHATYYSDHHLHHLNHVHNHPVLDDSRQSITSPYEGNKHLGSSGQEISSLSNHTHDKFCESSQARSNSGNNASLSSLRTAGQIGAGACKPGSSPVHGGPQSGPSLHHHYHHYYHHHHSSLGGGRQNYPNLSSSPTSVSPNSPGALPGHIQSSASSSSSSHQGYSTSQLHYLQQAASQSQVTDMPGANSPSSLAVSGVAPNVRHHHDEDCDTDQETDRLLGSQRNDERGYYEDKLREKQVNYIDNNNNPLAPLKRSSTSREGSWDPKVLIEGVLFRARYLGSTQLVCDGQPTKATRMMQAEEAVSRIKAPEGETQPSTEVDLFISTEKIMVLNTDLKEIMMDHALRTISYIADIGDLLVLMARRRSPLDEQNDGSIKRNPKMICHVFESDEAQYIAQSIGQAFQVAYMEFLKANGIKDSAFLKEMDYQEVLNSQEIFGDELEMFSKRDKQKEVIVPKQKGEILGIVIVESGWGSMLPTVVIANLAQSSPSARCGQLNIGDQIIAINGISLVGLPLSTCQNYVKNTKNQTAVKFTIVPCPPVVEVKIKRPDTKYQLGFSVQNGVICSLLRGGIAERGGVRVGHRIIEINGQSVVAVPHDRIVNLLATSVGEIHMKTMPTSMFRLLTGQESPSFM